MRGFKYLWLATASALAISAARPAAADEIQDLKAQVTQMMQRIQMLEQQQRQQPAAAKPAPSAGQAAPPPEPRMTSTSVPATTVAGEPVEAGIFPGSIRLPGTNTSLRIGGFVKLDAIYDVDAPQGDFSAISRLPLDGSPAAARRGNWHLQARQTRLGVQSRSLTDYGELRTVVEGDFYGGGGGSGQSTNGYSFEIRHAYAELDRFLVGQFWTTFMDIDALPEHEDNSGPTGRSFIRQGQIRYTLPLSGQDTLAFAIENPEGDFFNSDHGTAGTPSLNTLNPMPDVVARWRRDASWGHVQLSTVARDIEYNTGTPHNGVSTLAFGFGAAGVINTWGKDRISFQVNGGPGIGRYIQDAVDNTAFPTKSKSLATETAIGAQIAYQHWFTDTIRTNLIWATTHFDTERDVSAPTANADLYQQYVNLYWSPTPIVSIGIEYNRGERHLVNGQQGTANRFQAGFQYNF
jgi:hypothetical protein